MSNIISVTQFNTYIHNIFVAEVLLQNVQVYGEVSGLSFSGGNLYFSIKDEGAVLNCVKFGYANGYIPKEGEQILAVGSPNYYVKGGRFSFNVVRMEPYGQGLLYKQFLELKAKLEKLGLFDADKKKPLPKIIKRVGVVTSETGAVIQDIIDITGRRNPMLDIVLYPAKVQGIGAEETIIKGIQELDKTNVDVIIIARGGGSAEDLSTFNSESLAMVIASANKPIISAVGHETDFTIADFVADLRAPTPSAAAELVATDLVKLRQELDANTMRLIRLVDNFYTTNQTYVNLLYSQIDSEYDYIYQQKANICRNYAFSLYNTVDKIWNEKAHAFDLLTHKLESLNPIRLFKLGYSQTLFKDKVVTSINQVEVGDDISIKLIDGHLNCKVDSKKGEGK